MKSDAKTEQDATANTAESLDRLESLSGSELAAMLFGPPEDATRLEVVDEWGVTRDVSFGRPWMVGEQV